jgi:hypothetical protein
MPSWDEIRTHLRATHALVVDKTTWAGIEWAFAYDGAAFKQRVKIERAIAFQSDWVLILAAICNADQISPMSALRFNALLPIGGLVVEHGRCYLRAALPLEALSFRELDRAIELVAREAARLRHPGVPTVKHARVFTHYDD